MGAYFYLVNWLTLEQLGLFHAMPLTVFGKNFLSANQTSYLGINLDQFSPPSYCTVQYGTILYCVSVRIKEHMKKYKLGGVALSLITVLGMGLHHLIVNAAMVSTDNAYVHGELTQISAEASGRITQIFVNDNQKVEAGDLLATIDDRDYLARRNQAHAQLAMAIASLANNQARTELQQVKIAEANAYLEVAVAEHQHQHKELQRYGQLATTAAISQTRFDAQKIKTIAAKGQLETARLKLAAAKLQVSSLETEQEQLLANQRHAESSLVLAEQALSHTKILAPVSGVIGNRALQLGKFVKAGTGVLAIVPTDNVWLVANFKETQLTDIRSGQMVRVQIDSFPDTQLSGRVSSVSPSTGSQFSLLPADNANGNFVKIVQRVPVKILLEVPSALKGRVVPGLSAEVSVDTKTSQLPGKFAS
jgi:membrane fusion protein, multidrug efflux system